MRALRESSIEEYARGTSSVNGESMPRVPLLVNWETRLKRCGDTTQERCGIGSVTLLVGTSCAKTICFWNICGADF
jgi:hypothetical protein